MKEFEQNNIRANKKEEESNKSPANKIRLQQQQQINSKHDSSKIKQDSIIANKKECRIEPEVSSNNKTVLLKKRDLGTTI